MLTNVENDRLHLDVGGFVTQRASAFCKNVWFFSVLNSIETLDLNAQRSAVFSQEFQRNYCEGRMVVW